MKTWLVVSLGVPYDVTADKFGRDTGGVLEFVNEGEGGAQTTVAVFTQWSSMIEKPDPARSPAVEELRQVVAAKQQQAEAP